MADGMAIVRNTKYGSDQEGGKELSVIFEGGNHYNALVWDKSKTRGHEGENCPRAKEGKGEGETSKPAAGQSNNLAERRLRTAARTVEASRSREARGLSEERRAASRARRLLVRLPRQRLARGRRRERSESIGAARIRPPR